MMALSTDFHIFPQGGNEGHFISYRFSLIFFEVACISKQNLRQFSWLKFFKAKKKLYLEIDSFADNTEQPSLVGGFSLISSLQNCQLFVATLLTKKEYIAFTFISPSCFQAIISFWICKPTKMQRMRATSKMKWCHSLVLFTQLSAWGIKCPAFLVVFGVILVLVNLCLHTFTHMTVTSPGVRVGDYQQKSYSCWKMYCCIRKIHGDTWKEVLAF